MTGSGRHADFNFHGRVKPGDRIRFVSPASMPDRQRAFARARALSDLGFKVDFGEHAFAKHGPFAGTDEQRVGDLNAALRDPDIRAIFATRGGKGSYRIADQLDFGAARRDPKPLVGFSDITALHLSLFRHCRITSIHGSLFEDTAGCPDTENRDILLRILSGPGKLAYGSRPDEATSALSAGGAAEGLLIGGNLDMIVTTAGWALPDLAGALLLIEAVDCQPGGIDRAMTLLRKAGHLRDVAGIVVGQFTTAEPHQSPRIIDILGDNLTKLGVPVIGGLPFGHGARPLSVPIGSMASFDTASGTLVVSH
jgi:muramoyltetrapeptide carboxypeptidase